MALLVLQMLASIPFLIAALARERGLGIAAVAALASPLWYAVHFASGFAVVEPTVVGVCTLCRPSYYREPVRVVVGRPDAYLGAIET